MRHAKPRFGPPITVLISVLLLAPSVVTGQAAEDDGRGPLLADPQFIEPAQSPAFKSLTPEELDSSLKVIASRSYAYYGFNNPELQLHLPAIDNSTLARVEMPEPKLVDKRGQAVAFQLERGLHNPETQIAEIRFLTTDGESPATFARAVGRISLHYPIAVETLELDHDEKHPRLRIDGPFVDAEEGFIPETAPFAELQPLRAFDAQGRQLQAEPIGSSHMEGEKVFRRSGFHGRVARIEVDLVESWADVSIRYDVPIAAPLAEERRGVTVEDERAVKPDPSSRVEIEARSRTPEGGGEALGLSADARDFAAALAELRRALPDDPAIVSVNASMPTYIGISVEIQGEVMAWSWNSGEVSGPTSVDTSWLDCKAGMAPEALDLEALPRIFDESARLIGEGSQPLQIAVNQSPCGTAFAYIPFENGRSAQFDGQGRLIKKN